MGCVCGAQVPTSDQILAEGCAKKYGRATQYIYHDIDTCRLPVGEVDPIPNHSVFFTWLDEQILGCEVDAGTQGYDPSGEGDDIAVPGIIVHGLQRFGYVLGDGSVVSILGKRFEVSL